MFFFFLERKRDEESGINGQRGLNMKGNNKRQTQEEGMRHRGTNRKGERKRGR